MKICGVTHADDARAAEAAGADAVGLNFAPISRRRVTPSAAADIADALGPFVRRVGVFVDAGEEEILDAVAAARLDAVQLHGAEPAELAARLRPRLQVVRAVRFEPDSTPAAWAGDPSDALLLDGVSPGSGTPFSWDAARAWRDHPRLILAGGLTPENVGAAIAALRPYAVDVASGVEGAPGRKDAARMRAFVAAVRRAEASAAGA